MIHSYIISKEIHKGTKISSNHLEKLTDHCVEHKINMRNDEGCNPRSQVYNTRAPLSLFFFLLFFFTFFSTFWSPSSSLAWLFIEKSQKVQTNSSRRAIARPGELVTYAWRNLISPSELVTSLGEWMSEIHEKWPFCPSF